ncbi:hypothetical protein ELY33_10170 [Vreelandella andesensis]|uniref:Uncharacterized protein n=1 Tax=Vreelandella andesensis TaxID=447567 RepID=A0A3S0YHD8_9GAMM|nr:hypothetical protein [Halomonas andesensis]RUR30172.1 hypothetical protein ELY33_10170 [Halomonas andesensis]
MSKAKPKTWSESEAQTLLEKSEQEEHQSRWKTYYDISRQLFDELCPKELLKTAFVNADEARIVKVDDTGEETYSPIKSFPVDIQLRHHIKR